MRIGILSDIHDALDPLRAALRQLRDADALLVAGDLCSPFVLPILAKGFGGPIHVVFGNNDGDRFRMTTAARRFEHLTLHGEAFVGELGGRTVAMNHFPELAATMDGAHHELIVFGHDHRFRVERSDAGWRLDPGSLLGYDPAAGRRVPPSFLIYDTVDDRPAGFELHAAGLAPGDDPRTARVELRVVPMAPISG